MIPNTFEKFHAGIQKHAAILRRHGLADPASRNVSRPYSGKKTPNEERS